MLMKPLRKVLLSDAEICSASVAEPWHRHGALSPAAVPDLYRTLAIGCRQR